MRSLVPYCIPFIIAALPCNAQINAGEIPSGYSVLEPGIDLQLSTAFTSDTASFDVDCDGLPDIRAVLWQGEPAIDAPNSCALNLLNPALSLCADPPQYYWRPQYYAHGLPLDCSGNFTWRNDSVTVLGDVGGFSALGPNAVDSMYVAYQNGSQVGWILLSFDLTSGGGGLGDPVEMQIHQVLVPCIAQSVGEHANSATLRIYPNPVNDDVLRIEGQGLLRAIEVHDLTGKLIDQYSGNMRTIPSPAKAGVYMLRATYMDGTSTVVRFIQY